MFAVFLPPHALEGARVPVLYWLSGLTCTDENFMQKAGAQRLAAELGLALVAPDTSPRGEKVPADPEGSWDFGHGAGFYVDASQAPWSRHYRMHSYVTRELPDLVEAQLPISTRRGISGHSMGGHGALVGAMRHPGRYSSVSALAPIANPARSPWFRRLSAICWAATSKPGRHEMPVLCLAPAGDRGVQMAGPCRCWWTRAVPMRSSPANSSLKPWKPPLQSATIP